jgi:hypothetical protein
MLSAGLVLLVAGCGSSGGGNAQARGQARCTRAVARAASASDRQPATVRYATILEACTSRAVLDRAIASKVGQKLVATTEGQISVACADIDPAPAVCAELRRQT